MCNLCFQRPLYAERTLFSPCRFTSIKILPAWLAFKKHMQKISHSIPILTKPEPSYNKKTLFLISKLNWFSKNEDVFSIEVMRDPPFFPKTNRKPKIPFSPFFFPPVLMKNYQNLSQRAYFLKASLWLSKSQAGIFTSKFGSFSMHCVNYHEPLCMQKAGVWNVLPVGQRNIFWKHGIWVQAYKVKELIQHFLCIKEKKRRE